MFKRQECERDSRPMRDTLPLQLLDSLRSTTPARTSGLSRGLGLGVVLNKSIAQYLRRQICRAASGSKLVIVFEVFMCLSQFARRPPNVDNLTTRVLPSWLQEHNKR